MQHVLSCSWKKSSNIRKRFYSLQSTLMYITQIVPERKSSIWSGSWFPLGAEFLYALGYHFDFSISMDHRFYLCKCLTFATRYKTSRRQKQSPVYIILQFLVSCLIQHCCYMKSLFKCWTLFKTEWKTIPELWLNLSIWNLILNYKF